MQLLYVWIEEFRNIKELGFNFSSEYEVEFFPNRKEEIVDNKKNKTKIIFDNCVVSIRKRKGYVNAFFGEKISDITAIIGKNGTGKSNIIDFICTSIVAGTRQNLKRHLFVFQEGDKFYFYNKMKSKDDSPNFTYNLPERMLHDEIEEPEKTWDCIFYSNVADGREYCFEGNKVINLSYGENINNQSNKISYLADLSERKKNRNELSSLGKRLNIDSLSFINVIESEKLIDDKVRGDKLYSKYELLRARYKKAFSESKSNLNLLHYSLTFALFTYLY